MIAIAHPGGGGGGRWRSQWRSVAVTLAGVVILGECGHGFTGHGGYAGGYGREAGMAATGEEATAGVMGAAMAATDIVAVGVATAGAAGMVAGVGAALELACTLRRYRSTTRRCGQTVCPYYYADDNYFQWDSTVGQYETVDPPAEVKHQAATVSPDLIAYPKNGQTDAQQITDKSECQAVGGHSKRL